jgi:hypothetical protein
MGETHGHRGDADHAVGCTWLDDRTLAQWQSNASIHADVDGFAVKQQSWEGVFSVPQNTARENARRKCACTGFMAWNSFKEEAPQSWQKRWFM